MAGNHPGLRTRCLERCRPDSFRGNCHVSKTERGPMAQSEGGNASDVDGNALTEGSVHHSFRIHGDTGRGDVYNDQLMWGAGVFDAWPHTAVESTGQAVFHDVRRTATLMGNSGRTRRAERTDSSHEHRCCETRSRSKISGYAAGCSRPCSCSATPCRPRSQNVKKNEGQRTAPDVSASDRCGESVAALVETRADSRGPN